MFLVVMKINRYIFTLLAIPALLLTARVYAKNISSDIQPQTSKPVRAFLVVDKRQDSQIIELKGESQSDKLPQIIEDIDVLLYPEDKISVFPDLYMEMGGKITIERAPKIVLIDGKKKSVVRSWANTVDELLKEKNIELGQDDKIIPALTDVVKEGAEIKINRVAKTVIVEKKEIAYKTIKKNDPDLEKGNKKVETKGINGSKDVSYEVTRIDGEEVSRKLIKTEVTKEVVDEVLIIGTKVVVYGSGIASIWKESNEMVAACNFVSKGTKITVTNMNNKKSVSVTCMGGGLRDDRLIDLSSAAFKALGGTWAQGLMQNVRAEKYYPE